ncbi:MAG: hypothetical protein IJZ67_07720 [Alistipes sp.]|nr:hypothetical protein [Alistipes sp.]
MVHGLLSTNASLPFASEAKSLGLNDADLMLLLWGCNMLVSNDDRVILPSDYEGLYEGEGPLFRRQVRALKNGSSPLIEKGLFQLIDNDGRAHSDAHTLTSYVCEEILKDLGIESPTEKDNRLTSHSTIVSKELFYNPKEESSLSQLRSRSTYHYVPHKHIHRRYRSPTTEQHLNRVGNKKNDPCTRLRVV